MIDPNEIERFTEWPDENEGLQSFQVFKDKEKSRGAW